MVGLPIPSVRRAETGAATSAEPSALLTARMVSAFWATLHAPPECRCDHWRHPNDPDGGMCSFCEEQEWRAEWGMRDEDLEDMLDEQPRRGPDPSCPTCGGRGYWQDGEGDELGWGVTHAERCECVR